MTTTRPLVRWASINADGEVDIWKTKADARPRMKSLDAVTEIVRLVEAPRQIPVSERLPEMRVDVLVLNRHFANFGRPWCAVAYYDPRGKWFADDAAAKLDVTHWQPLPEPPKP